MIYIPAVRAKEYPKAVAFWESRRLEPSMVSYSEITVADVLVRTIRYLRCRVSEAWDQRNAK